jgi:hypothetical protein
VDSRLRDEELQPVAKLDKWQQPIVPASTNIRPLVSRCFSIAYVSTTESFGGAS